STTRTITNLQKNCTNSWKLIEDRTRNDNAKDTTFEGYSFERSFDLYVRIGSSEDQGSFPCNKNVVELPEKHLHVRHYAYGSNCRIRVLAILLHYRYRVREQGTTGRYGSVPSFGIPHTGPMCLALSRRPVASGFPSVDTTEKLGSRSRKLAN
ncbi:hypothetical protein V1478_011331, partial [Vespula squamosa]